jgi:hypothetical protein
LASVTIERIFKSIVITACNGMQDCGEVCYNV